VRSFYNRDYGRGFRFDLNHIRGGRKNWIRIRSRKRRMINALRFPTKWDNSGGIKVLTRNDLPVCQEDVEVHIDFLGVT
jgi:hypothetical protein